MLNIVIPMAGHGSRFADAGFTVPKPLINIHGKPMIQVVIENLTPNIPHRFIFVCLNQHIRDYNLGNKLASYAENVKIIGLDAITEGQLSSVLMARDHINNDHSLMIANCDQYIDIDLNNYLSFIDSSDFDGMIMTMISNDSKWSYAKLDGNYVIETAEKQVISNTASVGIFNFRRGRDFLCAADEMISRNLRVNNEFYIAPCYNFLIRDGYRFGVYNIGSEYKGMYGLGTPSDLAYFLNHPISKRLT